MPHFALILEITPLKLELLRLFTKSPKIQVHTLHQYNLPAKYYKAFDQRKQASANQP